MTISRTDQRRGTAGSLGDSETAVELLGGFHAYRSKLVEADPRTDLATTKVVACDTRRWNRRSRIRPSAARATATCCGRTYNATRDTAARRKHGDGSRCEAGRTP